MPANTAPIFPSASNCKVGTTLTTGDTTKTGTSLTAVWTAGPNGARIHSVELKPLGTNVISVLRLWLNNGSSPASATNNSMIEDCSMPATTNSETAGQPKIIIPIEKVVPAGWTLLAVLGTAVAAGWALAVYAEDF